MAKDYIPDECSESHKKNQTLSEHLRLLWKPLSISVVRRVETKSKHGWEIDYDQSPSTQPTGDNG